MAKINDDGFLELSGIHNKSFREVLNAEKFLILQDLSPLNLRVLNQASYTMHVAKGVEMMHAGDTPHDLYFINKGSVSIGKENDGKMRAIAKLMAGDFYGEYGVLRGKARFASVFTAETSEIIRVDLHAVHQVFDADKEFRKKVSAVMNERMLNSFLFGHPMFQRLTASTRSVLSKQLKVIELERGEVLFREGDNAEQCYLIISGEAEISIDSKGVSTVLEVRRHNNVLGEVRGNKGAKYGYAVRSANTMDLLVLDKAAVSHLQKSDEKVMPMLNHLINHTAKKTTLLLSKVLGSG